VTWRLVIEPQAEAEIFDAAAWLGQHDVGLRDRFLNSVEDSLTGLASNPCNIKSFVVKFGGFWFAAFATRCSIPFPATMWSLPSASTPAVTLNVGNVVFPHELS
jgi:hypothetical protein